MAAQHGSGGLDPADLRLAARAHAAGRARPLAAPVDVFDLRLPPALRPAVGAVRRGRVRDREGRVTHRQHRTHGPRRRPRAADRRCTRLATGPRAGRQLPAARTGRCRGAWRSIPRARATTSSCGSTRATSTRATAGRSPRATSCASASARSTRTTRSSSPRCGWSRTSTQQPHGYQGNWIPHRIRPAAEDGVFFAGDSAGPLPAADRRGDPDGVLLRDRARARAARGARRPPGQGGRAEALRRLQRLTPLEVRGDLRRAAVDPAPARPPARPPDAAVHAPQASRSGRSSTTWRSRRRSSPSPLRPPHAVPSERSEVAA